MRFTRGFCDLSGWQRLVGLCLSVTAAKEGRRWWLWVGSQPQRGPCRQNQVISQPRQDLPSSKPKGATDLGNLYSKTSWLSVATKGRRYDPDSNRKSIIGKVRPASYFTAKWTLAMNLFQLGIKNLLHKPWSTLLSLSLAALGAGLISLLLILNQQFQQQFDRNLAGIDLVIGAKGSPLQLILSSMYHVDAPTGNIPIDESKAFLRPGHPLIEASVPLSLGDNYRGYRIVGTTHEILSFYEAEVAEGTLWQKPMEVTAGALAAEKLGLKIGDTFNSGHGMDVHDNIAFTVVGILETSGTVLDQLLLTPNASLWLVHEHEPASEETAHEEGEDHDHADSTTHEHGVPSFDEPLHTYTERNITSILLKFKGKNFQALNMGRNINENTNLQAATPAIEINRLYANIGVGERILRALLGVIVVVSILSIFISLYSNLDERRYGLALMRVMGADRAKVMGLILLEGIVLAVVGCLIGILLSHLGMLVFANYIEEGYRYSFDPWVFLPEEGYLLLAALFIGAIAALIPALRARNTEIAGTLTEK